ncbi:MAG: alanine--tRNA ligase [Polyangiaceae bacterium]
MAQSAAELRTAFLEFFRARNHEVVDSAPLIPANDPTLMFTNAGMVQFKDVFTGREQRGYRRATSSQKCIRISGKHNDLENVGPSPRHHTFFEMLGNFSFGDYFKEEAIVYGWEFLTKEIGLDPNRFILTYFKGEEGVPADEVARDIWKRVTGFSDDRVIGLGMDDNFWQMGDTGPCGPCSELHYCVGPDIDLGRFGQEQTPEGHGWMEVWNLVFMQFERSIVDGVAKLAELPAPSIDTGAGLERLACIVQGKTSNYDVDLLRELVSVAEQASGKRYGATMADDDVSMRVIADHARTTAFLIGEGVLPDRTGREYVLRRVMRRAIRHGHRLGIERPFLHDVATRVVEIMGQQYPALVEQRESIRSVAEAEEIRFRQTIERGLNLLEERFEGMRAANSKELAGADAFQLYDTYGFPLDLTEVICRERGYTVDQAGYDAALEEARKRSEFKGMEMAVEGVYREAQAALPSEATVFSGYERDADESKIAALLVGGQLSQAAESGQSVEVVCERTPFYAESGGQVGDQGVITVGEARVRIADTKKPLPGLWVHRGEVESGRVEVGQTARLSVDRARREAIRKNHSATHLLHWALREVVGKHAQQKGSLVGPDRLRFDFTHTQPLSGEELAKIEDLVNTRVLNNSPVQTEVLNMDEARQRGAMMIFEEKYGDTVRMLTMAESVELCGGTHARATGDIGLFKIVSEGGIAAGVRRIFAVTGSGALDYMRDLESQIGTAARVAKTTPAQLVEKVEKLVADERALSKKLEETERKLATGGGSGGIDAMVDRAREVSGVKVLGVRTAVTDRGALRELAEQLRDKLGDSVVLVGSEAEGKAQLVLTVSKGLTARFKAGDLIRPIATIVGGSGGGRPDLAQAGGTLVGKLDEAIDAVYGCVN